MTRGRAEAVAWLCGGVGLLGAALGWFLAPATFPQAWLAALTAWLGWPLGCMALLFVHALIGGDWGYAIRSQLIAGMLTLVLLPLALVPLTLVLPQLYSWLQPEISARLDNGFYLNYSALIVRFSVYLSVWFGLAFWMIFSLRRKDRSSMLRRVAPIGLMLLAVTITFMMIDLTMSLDPHYASSVYGLIAIAEMGLLALSVAMFSVALESIDATTMRVLGRLLLALVILWAYLDFMQLLIVWQSDLPNEAAWYLPRMTGQWGVVAVVVAALHFVLPFLLLLSPSMQHSSKAIANIAALLILGQIFHSWWLVGPAFAAGLNIVDGFAMLGMLGAAAGLALLSQRIPWLQKTGIVDVR